MLLQRRQKERPTGKPSAFLCSVRKSGLRCGNSTHRAGVNTCAAIDAGISVDVVLAVASIDGVHRAGVDASAAVGAIVGNYMSQDSHLLF